MIPTHADQPTNSFYNAVEAGDVRARVRHCPNEYPAQLDTTVPVGRDPIAAELKPRLRHGATSTACTGCRTSTTSTATATRRRARRADDTGPSYINTFQRGPQESVWETVPQPTLRRLQVRRHERLPGPVHRDASYAKQWKFTNAPDADARAVQAAYWATDVGRRAGQGRRRLRDRRQGARRWATICATRCTTSTSRRSACVEPDAARPAPARTPRTTCISWYYAWGGATDTVGGLGLAHRLQPRARRLPEPAGRVRAEHVRRL